MISTNQLRIRLKNVPWLWLLAALLPPLWARGIQAEPNSHLRGILANSSSSAVVEVSGAQQALAESARKNGAQVEWNAVLGTPQRLRGTNLSTVLSSPGAKQFSSGGSSYEEKARSLMSYLAPLYGDKSKVMEYRVRKSERDNLGHFSVRLQQVYRGLTVSGSEVIVHFDQTGAVYEVNGEAIRDPGLGVEPGLSAEAATHAALRQLSAQGGAALQPVAETALVVFGLKGNPRLAYELVFVAAEENAGPARWRAWVDASDGTLILAYDDIQFIAPPSADGDNAQIKGNVLAAEGGQAISVTGWLENSGIYYLHSTNWSWQVYNLGSTGPDAATYAFRNDDSWGLSDPTEISVARNFDLTQRYFWAMHGRRSYDNAGVFAQANVHYSVNYANAFWSGGAFYFGDGNGTTAGSMVTLDIAAHEYTHAVTDYSSQLIYADESGALNESFCDIFGVCVEFFSQSDNRLLYPGKEAGTADWFVGEDCWLSAPALRDLRDPHNGNTVGSQVQPSRYRGQYWYTGTGDNGGVHNNSGVQNFFFYLLSEGGAGTNDGIAYNLSGIGITNAAQVAFRALTVYCTPSTDYRAARGAWISAAQDLDTNWVASVADAWSAVGIGSLQLSPATLVFRGAPGGPFTCPAPEITLHNWGATPLEWGVVSTQSWMQVTPAGGTISPLGAVTLIPSMTVEAQALSAGLYTNNLAFTNQQTPGSIVSEVRLYVGQPDSFTEVFDNNDLDLAYSSLTFTPDGSPNYYAVCREPAVGFPTDPAGGSALGLGDDSFQQVTLSGTNVIGIYNHATNVFFVGSNGYITAGNGDLSNLPTLANHFGRERIAALLNDLNPMEGGGVSWRELSDRVAITFQDVPVFGNPALTNSFQIEMFYSGVIRITYLGLAFQNGLAGLSAGLGVPQAFSESDLSGYASCHPSLSLQLPLQAREGDNILVGQGALSIPFPVATNLVVQLASSNTNEIWLQPSAFIVAGQTNVTFDLMIVDDTKIDGTQNVTLSAALAGWSPAQGMVAVWDNEVAALAMELPPSVTEWSGILVRAGMVTIPGTLPTNLVVSISSEDPSAAQAAAEVTIPAGELSNRFDIVVFDDLLPNGPVTVTLAASAPGFAQATNSMIIADDETPPMPFDPMPGDMAEAVGQTNYLQWKNGALPGQVVTNLVYFGTNSVPGPGELVSITTNTEWAPPLLVPQTEYYWQVMAQNVGTTIGPVWKFTTRGVDHFEWVPIASPQHSGEAFIVTIIARDEHGGVVSNFSGAVELSATVGNEETNRTAVELTPTHCGTFVEGVWSGTMMLPQEGTNVVLSASTADGKHGFSNPFNVLATEVISPTLSVANLALAEGGSLTNAEMVFQLSMASPQEVTVQFATWDGDAIAGTDYVATNAAVTFAPGETNLTIPITILGDALVESNEVFHLFVTNVVNAQLAVSNVTVTILNDDLPPPPPEMVLLTVFNPTNGKLSILVTNQLGTALGETNVTMYRSTNAVPFEWELMTNQLVLTNGVLWIEDLDTGGMPVQFFRARHVP